MTSNQRKVVFLDRDGTLIVERNYLNDFRQVEFLPGAIESLRLLRDLGFEFCLVTNQSGVASRRVEIANLRAIHDRIRKELAENGVDLLAIYVSQAPSGSEDFNRKPNPGMILTAAHEYKIALELSWMVGDKPIDVEVGRRAGCRTIFFKQPHSAQFQFDAGFATPHYECHNWYDILNVIEQAQT